MFDIILKEIFTQTERGFSKLDSPQFPVKAMISGKMLYQFLIDYRDADGGYYRSFFDFIAYAAPRCRSGYASDFADLWVLFIAGEDSGVFVDIGAGDGVNDSSTALLEAGYQWKGLAIENDKDNQQSFSINRRADVHDFIFICSTPSSIAADQVTELDVPCCGWARATSIDEEFNGNKLTEVLSFRQVCDISKLTNIDFLSIVEQENQLEILRNINLTQEKIPFVRVRHKWSMEMDSILDYMVKEGYSPWLPEFTAENFYFINSAYAEKRIKRRNSQKEIDFERRFNVFERKSKARNSLEKDSLEIVSVHFPKTGGVSLVSGLEEWYGDSLLKEYAYFPGRPNFPSERPLTLGKKFRAVHGHFAAHKYINMRPSFFITFIREPVDRLISLYFHWKTHGTFNEQQRHFMNSPHTIVDFARSIGSDYVSYFGRVDIDKFNFIGRTEHYSEDLEVLSKLTGIPFSLFRLNVGKISVEREELLSNSSILGALRNELYDDMIIYDRMLKIAGIIR